MQVFVELLRFFRAAERLVVSLGKFDALALIGPPARGFGIDPNVLVAGLDSGGDSFLKSIRGVEIF